MTKITAKGGIKMNLVAADRAARDMHRLLYIYNGLVVLILVAFMCLTQQKIAQSMLAQSNQSTQGVLSLLQ